MEMVNYRVNCGRNNTLNRSQYKEHNSTKKLKDKDIGQQLIKIQTARSQQEQRKLNKAIKNLTL